MSLQSDNVLSNSLRPKILDDVVGLKDIVKSIKEQFETKRIPHFYLLSGDTGLGKTTLSRIIALMLQKAGPNDNIAKYDIKEINASDKNGVDDIRALIETSKFKPMGSSFSKVIILDECHQLTTAAQNALLKITEDAYDHLYFIFCTSNPNKIIETLKRRAYIIRLCGLNDNEIEELLQKAAEKYKSDMDIEPLKEVLIDHLVNSPGLILQAAEKYFNGVELSECVGSGYSSDIDVRKLCASVSKGSWKESGEILKSAKKEDVYMLKACVTGYLKAIMIKVSGKKSVVLARAIKLINEYYDDLPTFLANICLACAVLRDEY